MPMNDDFKFDAIGPRYVEQLQMSFPKRIWKAFAKRCDEEEICPLCVIKIIISRYHNGIIPKITENQMNEYLADMLKHMVRFVSARKRGANPSYNKVAWHKDSIAIPNKLYANFLSEIYSTGYYPDHVIGNLIQMYTEQKIDRVTDIQITEYVVMNIDKSFKQAEIWFYYDKILRSCGIDFKIPPPDDDANYEYVQDYHHDHEIHL